MNSAVIEKVLVNLRPGTMFQYIYPLDNKVEQHCIKIIERIQRRFYTESNEEFVYHVDGYFRKFNRATNLFEERFGFAKFPNYLEDDQQALRIEPYRDPRQIYTEKVRSNSKNVANNDKITPAKGQTKLTLQRDPLTTRRLVPETEATGTVSVAGRYCAK